MKPIAWSIGLQSRAAVQLGQHPDMEEVARTARRYGVQETIIFGKDHTGFCFHPTKYGIMHPNLQINLTKGLSDAMHQYGIRTIAYVNFGMDGEAGRRRPDWLQKTADGKASLLTPDHYANLCVFTPYLTEYILPAVREMLLECGVNGIFFDTMSAFDYCACPVCRGAFKKTFGKELPTPGSNSEDWDLYGPWQYERMECCLTKIRRCIDTWKPGAKVLFNHLGGPAWPFPFPGIPGGMVSCDPPAFFPWISLFASYLSAMPVTGDVFIERFARGWGDRNANNELTMQYKSAAIFAHRQRFCVGDRIHPDWKLSPGTSSALNIISKVWRKFNQALPASLLDAPDFLLLYPESYKSGHARKAFRKPRWEQASVYSMTALGAFRLLMDCGRSVLTVPEMALQRNLARGKVLIIANAEFLNPETNRSISQFVSGGGCVLLAEKVPRLEDGTLPEWCGFRAVEEDSDQQCPGAVYLPDLGSCRRKKGEERPLLRSNVSKLCCAGAKALLFGYPQEYGELFRKTPYPSFYMSSADTPMETPLLTRNRYGRGTVWFLNCALFTDYADSALAIHKQWAENLFRRVHPRAAFELLSPAGDVEIVSYRAKDRHDSVHILLNHGGRRGSLRHLFASEQIPGPQPAYPVTLKIRSKKDVCIFCEGEKVPWVRKGAFIQVPVVMDSLWKSINFSEKS